MDATNNDEWWGYSEKHGWVVLDRSVAENQPGSSAKFLFVRCRDWSIYEEIRENWKAPRYIFVNSFISKLSTDDSKKVTEEVARLKNDYKLKRRSLHTQYSMLKHGNKEQIIEKHKAFLELIGEKPGSYKVTTYIDPSRRITHCYSCKNHIDNVHNLECTKCGWIICENCGACGCGYHR